MNNKLFVSLLLALCCLLPGGLRAGGLVVAFGESLEPYVIPQLESGIEVDIIRAALEAGGMQLKPVFLAQKRLPYAFANPAVQAIATMLPGYGVNGAYSDVYISYEDKAITLASRELQFKHIADLANYSILAFPMANRYLGAEFSSLASQHPAYSETGNQLDQNRLLYRGSVDVVVADIHIFKYMNRRLLTDFHEVPREVKYHDLFPRVPYRVLFRSPELRDRFNNGLQQLQRNGLYQQILARYS
ncbi:substrate-binding periplasmic protein [Vogesella oryzae]|uniref:substrate-binding periplasmic protein n=1 Tax=Vogesella oryzae TaxID=1735285 RepID=UPI001583785B|nr:transporter substrate-binding domain-containing protein [Vogesella oryzae]